MLLGAFGLARHFITKAPDAVVPMSGLKKQIILIEFCLCHTADGGACQVGLDSVSPVGAPKEE